MKYIITERQEEYLKRFEKFKKFMKRRDKDIKELILKFSNRPRTNPEMVLDNVLVELTNINKIDSEDDLFQWVYFYLQDNYYDYINQIMLEK